MRRASKFNDLPSKEYLDNGYREWGNKFIFEYERTMIKRGPGNRYQCTAYRYSKLKQCERCGKIGGRQHITCGYFNFAEKNSQYDKSKYGQFCLGCRNTLRALQRKIRDWKETEKLIGAFRRESNARA